MIVAYIAWRNPHPETIFLPDSQSFEGLCELFGHEVWTGCMLFFEYTGFEVCLIMSGKLSPDQAAAFTSAIYVGTFFFSVAMGTGFTIMSLIGNSFGERNYENAKHYLYAGVIYVFSIGLVVECILFFLAEDIAVLLEPDQLTINDAVVILHTYMIGLLFDFVSFVLGSGLRAVGKGMLGSVLMLIAFYGIGIPLAYILCFKLDWQVKGLVWGLNAAFIITTIMYSIAFSTFDWKVLCDEINIITDQDTKALEAAESSPSETKNSLLVHVQATSEDDDEKSKLVKK